MKVAIVTFEFEGITRNGGIGTAFRQIGELLLEAGHSVTVVLMPFGSLQAQFESRDKEVRLKVQSLRRRGFEIVTPDLPGKENAELRGMSYHLRRSLLVHSFLRKRRFDVVHTTDNCGLTYFSLLAKKQGAGFARTLFVMGAHGSTLWTQEANHSFTIGGLALAELDRRSMEMADILVSPSRYMVEDLRKKKWVLPRTVRVIPNVNRLDRPVQVAASGPATPRKENRPPGIPKTLIFFGRLERRKGIFVFVDSVCRLLDRDRSLGARTPLEIVFLGKDEPLQYAKASDFIRNRLRAYGERVTCRFMSDCSSDESLEFLSGHDHHLVCIPSLIDNSPYVVLEAIERGLDFVASDTGGQVELIHPKDRKSVLTSPTVEALEASLRKRLFAPLKRARPSPAAKTANRKWIQFHAQLSLALRRKGKKLSRPKRIPSVSVVLGTKTVRRADAMLTVLRQKYPNLEICLPTRALAMSRHRHRLVRYADKLVGRYGDLARKVARGKYVLFLDDAEFCDPHALSRLVQAAEQMGKPRDLVGLCGLEGAYVERESGAGRALVWSVPHVCFGSVGALTEVVRPRFALWHRTEVLKHLDRGRQDWGTASARLFSKLVVAGSRLELFAAPVVCAPPAGDSSSGESESPLDRIRPFLDRRAMASQWAKVVLLSVVSNEEKQEAQRLLFRRYKEAKQSLRAKNSDGGI